LRRTGRAGTAQALDQEDAALRVGLVGAGAMGLPIALRLAEQGHAVAVCDIDPERRRLARAAGLALAATPAAAAEGCALLVVVVVDGVQTQDVLFGPDGAAAARPEAVLLCPTIAPEDTEAAAAALAARGIAWIDAPMSGGPARARDGTMSLMVACPDAPWARWQPLLATLATRLVRVGVRAGDGARTKLVNNLLAAVNLAGAAEALALAARLGLDAQTTLAVIEASSGQSWIGSDRARRALAGDERVLARTALLAKDSALALAMATGAGFEAPLGRTAAARFARALEQGLGDADDAVLFTPAPISLPGAAAAR
jgi:3-hydroxyisobutyrate dehydrogenase-like beta-hydroxyacid dehydrogenase